MIGKEEFESLGRQLKRLSAYLNALEDRLLIADPASVKALTLEQARDDYELFSRTQLNILEFYRKWKVQNKGDLVEEMVPPSVLALAEQLSSLDPEELAILQKGMLRLVQGGSKVAQIGK